MLLMKHSLCLQVQRFSLPPSVICVCVLEPPSAYVTVFCSFVSFERLSMFRSQFLLTFDAAFEKVRVRQSTPA